jgi:hypothetical protein
MIEEGNLRPSLKWIDRSEVRELIKKSPMTVTELCEAYAVLHNVSVQLAMNRYRDLMYGKQRNGAELRRTHRAEYERWRRVVYAD